MSQSQNLSSSTLTLLFSRGDLPKNWQKEFLPPFSPWDQVHLFLLDQATHMLRTDFSQLPSGKRVFCAHSHRLLGAQPATKESKFIAGGLANLGEMVRDSHGTISLPNTHWPTKKGKPGVKSVGILLGNEPSRQKEAIRLAAGLAGCNHTVTLYTPMRRTKLQACFPEMAPLLEALQALRATFKTASISSLPGNHPVLLQL